jgi:hypothetical protein
MLLLLKTSSRKKSSKRGHSSKRRHSKTHKQPRHSHHHQQPIPVFGNPRPVAPMPAPAPPPMAFGKPMPFVHHHKKSHRKSKHNLKGDIEKVLQKVRKVQTNKKVMKYKTRLDNCMADASCTVNDKNCIKTHCGKELKKYNKRFDKEYKKLI